MPESGREEQLWLAACRRGSGRIATLFAGLGPTGRPGQVTVGAGGDTTLRVDHEAESIVIDELAATGLGFRLMSEEAGELEVNGGGRWLVVLDPIDGSLNAGRGMTPFATALAFADGETMDDVRVAFVADHGTGERFEASAGGGALVDGRPVATAAPDGGPVLVLIEGALPHRVRHAARVFEGHIGRVRAVGSLALSLCYVAAGRGDAMVGLGPGRAVDVAGAQLFAREAGLLVGMPRPADVASAPLDLTTRRTIAAARDERLLELMLEALLPEELVGG